MKAIVKVVGLLVLGAAISSATAEDKPATKESTKATVVAPQKATVAKPVQAVAAEPKKQVLTGSHIPQKVELSGFIARSASPVFVIDGETIRRSGAHDVADLLRRGGWAR